MRVASAFQPEELVSAKALRQEKLDVFKEQQGGRCDWNKRKGGESSRCASLLGRRAEIKSSERPRAGPDPRGGQRSWSDAVVGQRQGTGSSALPSFPPFGTVAAPSPLGWLLWDTLLWGTVGQLGWGDVRDAGVGPRRGQGQHSWGGRHHLQLIFLCHLHFL